MLPNLKVKENLFVRFYWSFKYKVVTSGHGHTPLSTTEPHNPKGSKRTQGVCPTRKGSVHTGTSVDSTVEDKISNLVQYHMVVSSVVILGWFTHFPTT